MTADGTSPKSTAGRYGGLVLAAGLVVAGLGLYAVASRLDSGPDSRTQTGTGDVPRLERLGVDDFAARIAEDDTVVINVHTPYEGEIPDTDLLVPFDRIGADPDVPQDRDTPIALYCRSGRMSQDAAETLRAKGYSNIVDLDGGMRAWAAAGRELLDPGSAGGWESEQAQPSSLPRPGERMGASNPAGLIAVGLLLVGWFVGFGVLLYRGHRRSRWPRRRHTAYGGLGAGAVRMRAPGARQRQCRSVSGPTLPFLPPKSRSGPRFRGQERRN